MLSADRLKACEGAEGVLALLADLGYPVAPVEVDAEEWRRGGVPLPWNGSASLRIVSRLRRFDLFLLTGRADTAQIDQFLTTYSSYNLTVKSVLIYLYGHRLSIFARHPAEGLRRLDVDLARPGPHAVDRLNLLACADEASLPRVFERALDRESVTRRFFARFRSAVREVGAALGASCPAEEPSACETESLLILSRLLFLSFIQEKGWLNGERRFLVDRLEAEIASGREFFSGILLPLFFGCLNTPLHARNRASRRLGRIPYLNGGLFEPSSFEQRNREMHLPNDLMQRVLEELFEKFDFRVDEHDTMGAHVDPEMLGKVFESLMASDERLASGSFYTPKEIVETLTTRAVEEWLEGGDAGSPAARLERLQEIRVLDPACGSGAFLLSALGVIESRWRQLAGEAGVPVPGDLRQRIVSRCLFGVDLKPEAVRLCELRLWLAIVSAADVPIEAVEPLPNLDRNILQGNSLLSPTDFLGDGRADLYAEWVHALHAQRDLLERYRTAPHAQRPALYRLIRGNDQRIASELLCRVIEEGERELQSLSAPRRDLFGHAVPVDTALCGAVRERLDAAHKALEKVDEGALDFFSYDIHFAHVMAGGGFDVVVGNPPWVRNSRIDGRARRMLSDRYALFRSAGRRTAFHQPDLAIAFLERSLALAAPSGSVALLMPAKIVNSGYAAPLRRWLLERARLVALHDWSDDPRRRRWFEADTFPLGIVISNRMVTREPTRDVSITAAGESFVLPPRLLSAETPSAEWALVPPEVAVLLRRLRSSFRPMEQMLGRRPFMGVKTGDNEKFFLPEGRLAGGHVVSNDGVRVPLDSVCRCVRGRDVGRWSVRNSSWMLWPPPNGWEDPPRWVRRFARRRGIETEKLRLSFVRPEHVGFKVAWKDLSRGMAAAVLRDAATIDGHAVPLVPNQTLYAIDAVSLEEAHALAAVLNSSAAGALLVAVAERAKDAHFRYFGRTVAALPFPDISSAAEELARLSRRAHRGTDVQEELDRLVASLYGLREAELALLVRFLAGRTGAR